MPALNNKNNFRLLSLFILIIAVMSISKQLQTAQPMKTAQIAKNEFSAQRAQVHVETIALKPHPVGSLANAETRDYLIKTLRILGATVEVQRKLQTFEGQSPRAGQSRFAYVENVVAYFPGTQYEKAILLMAHYDSKPNTPGAGDNASGVAAVLETARALTADGIPMQRPLIILLSDAEEIGLLGSQAFFGHHRWAEQIGLVLNLDSRGNAGPVFMYQTSKNNAALIKVISEVVESPMATSLVNSIFSKLPFGSDFSIALNSGKVGMNFAFIDGFDDYHTSADMADSLSLNSLQHLGDFALPLVRHFGNNELPIDGVGDYHYFNPLGDILISYPGWLDWLLWLISAGLLVFMNSCAVKAKTYTLSQLIYGIGHTLFIVALPLFLIFLIDRITDQSIIPQEVLARQNTWFICWTTLAAGALLSLHYLVNIKKSYLHCLTLTFLLIILVVTGGVNNWMLLVAIIMGMTSVLLLRQPLGTEAIYAGGLVLLQLIALLLLYQLPGGAYVLIWPLLSVAIFNTWRWWGAKNKPMTTTSILLTGLPAIILLGTTAMLFDQLVGYSFPFASVLPMLLLIIFFMPLLENKSAWIFGCSLTLIGVLFLSWLLLTSAWSTDNPQPVAQFVLYDVNEKQAYWASEDNELTNWHRIKLGDYPEADKTTLYLPNTDRQIWLFKSEPVKVLTPKLELLEANEQNRLISFQIKPSYAGDTIALWLSPSTKLLGWNVEDNALVYRKGNSPGWSVLEGFAIPKNGIKVTLKLAPSNKWPELLLTNVHNDLPEDLTMPPRNSKQMRGLSRSHSDSTVSFQRIALSDLVDAIHSK